MRRTARTAFALYFVFGATAAHAEQCNEILRLGYTNIESISSNSEKDSVQKQDFCSSEYSNDKSTSSLKVEAAYGLFSGGLASSDGNIREAQKRVCTSGYGKEYSKSAYKQDVSTIYQGALNAWTTCLAMKASGLDIDIKPYQDLTGVVVEMAWRRSGKVKFRGIDHNDDVTCNVTSDTKHSITTADMTIPLTTSSIILNCKRTPVVENGVTSYKPGPILFKTTEKGILLEMPPINTVNVKITDLQRVLQAAEEAKRAAEGAVSYATDRANELTRKLLLTDNPIKLCRGYVPGNFSDTIVVPEDTGGAFCDGWARIIGATVVEKQCLHKNGITVGAGGPCNWP